MIYRILEITVPVFGIVLLAFLLGRWRRVDMEGANHLNLVLFIPALIFHSLTERTDGEFALWQAIAGCVAIVLGSGLLAWPVARLCGWQPQTLVPPAMFNNCGNMGIPLAVFAFGEQALPVAVILLVTTTTLQFTLGLGIVSGRVELRGLVRNPMLIATAAGVAAMAMDWHAPALVLPALDMLGSVAIPLMLVALGMRLAEGNLRQWRIGVMGGLLAPLTGIAVALPWIWLTEPSTGLAHNLILYAVLPPAVMNFMMAERFGREPASVAAIVAVGNAASLLIIPVTLAFLL